MAHTNPKLPRKVAVLYTYVKREYFPTEEQFVTEKTAFADASVVAKHIEELGVEVVLLAADENLVENLKMVQPEVAFNLVGSIHGQEYLAAAIPSILEILKIPYTGAGMLGESLAYNKFLIKKLLQQVGVPVPNYQLFITPEDPLSIDIRFPVISKLNEIHGSVEITKDAVSENEEQLRTRIKRLMALYKQPILIEEFIAGREVEAFVLNGRDKRVFIVEEMFGENAGTKDYKFLDFDYQWKYSQEDIASWGDLYQKFESPLITEHVKKAFDITKMADYGKFDIRIDASGRHFVVDANSNPFFGPKETGAQIAFVLEMYGISFSDILKTLMQNALSSNC